MIERYISIIKKNRAAFIIAASGLATILLINETISFIDKITKNIMLAAFSALVFYTFVKISIKAKVWEKQ